MLDRLQVLRQIEAQSDQLWSDTSALYAYARVLFQKMAADNVFFTTSSSIPLSQQLPQWLEPFDAMHSISTHAGAYTVIAVDGSQIYPDRHYGASYYLLNLGGAVLRYNTNSSAHFYSEPLVCVPSETDDEDACSIDMINCRRHELELRRSYELAVEYKQRCADNEQLVVLLDGSYIAWHLQAKDVQLQQKFLPYQLYVYELLYQERLPVAGYISMPRSKEIVNLMEWYHEHYTEQTEPCDTTRLLDTTIASFFLDAYTRTAFFANTAPISLHYPQHLRPWFCYLDVNDEIVRLEIPYWLAQDTVLLERTIACIRDQSDKGKGFPVCLAEAHEQAVVKGPDRDFFYQSVEQNARMHGRVVTHSQKSMKKRGIAI
jgi:hypothetical protein